MGGLEGKDPSPPKGALAAKVAWGVQFTTKEGVTITAYPFPPSNAGLAMQAAVAIAPEHAEKIFRAGRKKGDALKLELMADLAHMNLRFMFTGKEGGRLERVTCEAIVWGDVTVDKFYEAVGRVSSAIRLGIARVRFAAGIPL